MRGDYEDPTWFRQQQAGSGVWPWYLLLQRVIGSKVLERETGILSWLDQSSRGWLSGKFCCRAISGMQAGGQWCARGAGMLCFLDLGSACVGV